MLLWTNMGWQVAWTSTLVSDDLLDDLDRAWDHMVTTDPAWNAWITEHSRVKEPFNYLEVADVDEVRVRRRRGGGLDYRVPAAVFEGADVRAASRALIRELFVLRAEASGVPPPPPV